MALPVMVFVLSVKWKKIFKIPSTLKHDTSPWRKTIAMPKKKTPADGTLTEVWYLALHKLHMAQGPGTIPSSIRFHPGQRFTLDGDEPVDIDSLLRTGAVKLYEESDEAWAQAQLADRPQPKRRRNRG